MRQIPFDEDAAVLVPVGARASSAAADAVTPAAQTIVRVKINSLCRLDVAVTEVRDGGTEANLDAKLGQGPLGGFGKLRGKSGQQSRARVDQDDARALRRDAAEVTRYRTASELGDCAGHFDSGRTAADHDEGQQRLAALGIRLGLGSLEREQDLPPDRERVFERSSGRERARPLVVAEIAVARAGREDQPVVIQRGTARQLDPRVECPHARRLRRAGRGRLEPRRRWRGSAPAMSAGDRAAVATW